MEAVRSDRHSPSPEDDTPRRGWLWALALVGVGGAAVAAWLALGGRSLPGTGGLMMELRDRGRIAVVGAEDLTRLEVRPRSRGPTRRRSPRC